MHCISAIIFRSNVDLGKGNRFLRKTKLPDFVIASESALHDLGIDVNAHEHVSVYTDYFGGPGHQSASYRNPEKEPVHFSDDAPGGAINSALKIFGVKASSNDDLFDTIGLGRYRKEEDLLPAEPEWEMDDEEEPEEESFNEVFTFSKEDYEELVNTLEDMTKHKENMTLDGGDYKSMVWGFQLFSDNALKLAKKAQKVKTL